MLLSILCRFFAGFICCSNYLDSMESASESTVLSVDDESVEGTFYEQWCEMWSASVSLMKRVNITHHTKDDSMIKQSEFESLCLVKHISQMVKALSYIVIVSFTNMLKSCVCSLVYRVFHGECGMYNRLKTQHLLGRCVFFCMNKNKEELCISYV